MFDRTTYADQQVFVNGEQLSGVQSVDGSFDVPYENFQAIGMNSLPSTPINEIAGTMNIMRFVVGADPLQYLTGISPCRGYVYYKTKSFGFHTGYLTSYQAKGQVGSIPEISTDFLVYGSLGGGISDSLTQTGDYPISIARPGSIVLTLAEAATDRILSYNYGITINRIPYYEMGSNLPSEVLIDSPIEINLNFVMEIDTYECRELYNLLCNPHEQNISIALKTCDKSATIITYSADNAKFYGTNFTSSVNSNARASLKFKSFLM